MKRFPMLVCLAAGATLFGLGCGGAPEETTEDTAAAPEQDRTVSQQACYSVCWPTLGVYSSPSTSSIVTGSMVHGRDTFCLATQVFWSNGEYWVYGSGGGSEGGYDYFFQGYVRWAGLCH